MLSRVTLVSLALATSVAVAACTESPTAAVDAEVQFSSQTNACWGQATKVFAQMREMGIHSSSQGNPRAGLRNLARLLVEAGVIPDDSMTSLGRFVADELGLTIEACS